MVGPHNILISPALITSLTTRGIVCDVWVVNAELEKQWLRSLGCIVTSDRLFSFADASPFADSEPAPARAMLGLAAPLAERVPSINLAAEHVASSYYINHPEAMVVAEPSSDEGAASSDEDGEAPETTLQSPPKGLCNDANDGADEAAGSSGSAATDVPVGTGEVSVSHLRTDSDAFAPTPAMSPSALAVAEDRVVDADMPIVFEEESEIIDPNGISQRKTVNTQ